MNLQMKTTKMINLLTICRKAGKMCMGFDTVKESLQTGIAKCVMISSDVSPKTLKEIEFFSTKFNVKLIYTDIKTEEFWQCIGKRVAVISVCDEGFAKKFISISDE